MKKLLKFFLGFVVFLVLICLILFFPSASDAAAKVVNSTGTKVRSIAQTVCAIAIALVLVVVGAAVVAALPLLGAALVIAGLGMLAWNVWPLFSSSSSSLGGSVGGASKGL